MGIHRLQLQGFEVLTSQPLPFRALSARHSSDRDQTGLCLSQGRHSMLVGSYFQWCSHFLSRKRGGSERHQRCETVQAKYNTDWEEHSKNPT